jgi:hypothetical protein|tara:strand:+ start:532 stop:783 length:252 start_codon:yes stop_codon:yes gene_type:complete
MDIKVLFGTSGDLLFDPFRTEETDPRYMALFDDGMLKCEVVNTIKKMVKTNSWSPWCDAVGLIHADQMASGTKGNYSTVYYFR